VQHYFYAPHWSILLEPHNSIDRARDAARELPDYSLGA